MRELIIIALIVIAGLIVGPEISLDVAELCERATIEQEAIYRQIAIDMGKMGRGKSDIPDAFDYQDQEPTDSIDRPAWKFPQ